MHVVTSAVPDDKWENEGQNCAMGGKVVIGGEGDGEWSETKQPVHSVINHTLAPERKRPKSIVKIATFIK